MSKQTDFMNLLKPIWEVEQINMWLPWAHSSLAYLIDRAYDESDYTQKYDKWYSLAIKKDFNELSWSIANAILEEAKKDERISAEGIETIKNKVGFLEKNYKRGECSMFGCMDDDYAPDWFWAIFATYMNLEELRRENTIKEYMIEECGMSPKQAEKNFKQIYEHYDILNELYAYIKTRQFKTFYPCTAEGYTAEELYNTTRLAPMGAFNYLVSLRDMPEEALDLLKKGLPRD